MGHPLRKTIAKEEMSENILLSAHNSYDRFLSNHRGYDLTELLSTSVVGD